MKRLILGILIGITVCILTVWGIVRSFKTEEKTLSGQVREIVEEFKPCDEDLDLVTLENLDLNAYSNNVDSIENIERYKKRIECYRKWTETIENKCIKMSYIKWLDYYEDYANRELREIKDKKNNPEEIPSWVLQDQKRIAYEMTHSVPKPEGCDFK